MKRTFKKIAIDAGASERIGAVMAGALACEGAVVVANCASDREIVGNARDVFAGMPSLKKTSDRPGTSPDRSPGSTPHPQDGRRQKGSLSVSGQRSGRLPSTKIIAAKPGGLCTVGKVWDATF
jgi:hypothetical protein